MWCILAVMSTGGAFAQASPQDQARALYEQGVRYYEQGDYDTAVRLWRRTYELTPLPPLLYNIAKATEESNHPKEALAAWKEYRAIAPADGKAGADAKIAALELVVATLSEAPAPAPAPARVAAAPVPADPPADPALGGAAVGGPPSSGPPRRPPGVHRSYRTLGSVLLATGGVGAVVGGSLVANHAHTSSSAAAVDGCANLGDQVICDSPTSDALRSGRMQIGIGGALIGVGAALGGGSVLLAVAPGRGADLTLTVEL